MLEETKSRIGKLKQGSILIIVLYTIVFLGMNVWIYFEGGSSDSLQVLILLVIAYVPLHVRIKRNTEKTEEYKTLDTSYTKDKEMNIDKYLMELKKKGYIENHAYNGGDVIIYLNGDKMEKKYSKVKGIVENSLSYLLTENKEQKVTIHTKKLVEKNGEYEYKEIDTVLKISV